MRKRVGKMKVSLRKLMLIAFVLSGMATVSRIKVVDCFAKKPLNTGGKPA